MSQRHHDLGEEGPDDDAAPSGLAHQAADGRSAVDSSRYLTSAPNVIIDQPIQRFQA